MSIIQVKTGTANNRKARAKYQVMNNSGFGKVKIVQQGEKRLSVVEQYLMTVEEAMRLCENGLAITAE